MEKNLLGSVPTNLENALNVLKPHFESIKGALMNSYLDTVKTKDTLFENGVSFTMTPKTKGCIMSDVLPHHLKSAFANVGNVQIIDLNGVVGLLFNEGVFIKFNKMDENNTPSIQQRKWYKAITNQGQEIEGLPKQVIKLWAGIVPIDKQWSSVARCSLVYFEGGTVVWDTNLTDTTVRQLSIDITPPSTKRRTKPKSQDSNEQGTQTGTDNK